MSQYSSPGGRSTRRMAQREREEQRKPEPAGRKSRKGLFFSFVLMAAALVALVAFTPKEPHFRALNTIATESGEIAGNAGISAAYEGLRVSELMASNHTAVTDEAGNYPDWIEVWNSSDHTINLEGVGLSDDGNSIRFLFPAMELKADERVVVFCDNTNQVESGKPLHARFKLSSAGENVYLFDPDAFQLDSTAYRILSSDTSWALLEDGQFREVSYYSPGYPNTEAGHQAYRSATMVSDGALIINEVMADALSGIADEDGEYSDWVELYNTSNQTVSLSNYALSDNETKPLQWRFPDGAVVAPHGYYLVYCSGKNRRDDPTAIPHTNFRISAEHDTLVLCDGRGRVVDRVIIDNLPADSSYARDENGMFSVHSMATPGRSNQDTTGADLDMRARNPMGVYISEVMASNQATVVFPDGPFVDWIEIYNSTDHTVDLSGCGLSDTITRARKWQFPSGVTIAPGEYKVVLCDGNTSSSDGRLHTSFRILRSGAEVVCFSDPQGRVLDKIVLPAIRTNVSYGRTVGMSGLFYYDAPTPGAENSPNGFLGYAQKPSFSVNSGLHYSVVRTEIQVPENTTVYYTTDGSIPTQDSTAYRGETLEMSFTSILRARAFSDNPLIHPSEILSGSYFINTYHSLPIVSVITDPNELWNPDTGMFTLGSDVIKEPGKLPFPNTIYRKYGKIPRPVHVEYYAMDGTEILNQDAEFSLMGEFSLDMPQKSMKFRAKSLYGNKTFAAPLFEDRPYTEYKSFVLRNSGNDCMWTRLLDGFQSRLLDAYGSTVIHQAWNPVVVYINGIYWGHMNMRERVDKYFVAQHEGLELNRGDSITILEASGTLKVGSNSVRREYKNMISRIKSSDPKRKPEDLQYILDNVDVENYFEYIALEMFLGNSDIGNTRFYRTAEPGAKWRWILYDVDYGLYSSSFNSPKSYTKAKGMGEKNIDNTILVKLLTVPEYKDSFLRKLGSIYRMFTTEFMLSVLEPLVEQIRPEMTLHWARWGEENDPYVISEVPTTADGAYRYWEKRIERLRNTLKKRPNLLWGYIKDAFSLNNEQMNGYFGLQPEMPADAI